MSWYLGLAVAIKSDTNFYVSVSLCDKRESKEILKIYSDSYDNVTFTKVFRTKPLISISRIPTSIS